MLSLFLMKDDIMFQFLYPFRIIRDGSDFLFLLKIKIPKGNINTM